MTNSIQVQFVTTDSSIDVPSDSFRLPAASTSETLSELINSLCPTNSCLTYAFTCNNVLIQSDLDQFISQYTLSLEECLTLNVFVPSHTPEPQESFPHPDWVSSLVGVSSVSFLSGCYDGSVHLWTNGKSITANLHQGVVSGLDVFNHNSSLYIASAGRDGKVSMSTVNETQIQEVGVMINHPNAVECLAIAPGGSLLTTGCWDSTVRIYPFIDEDQGEFERDALVSFEGHSAAVSCVEWKVEGSILSGSYDQCLRVWDVATANSSAQIYSSAAVFDIASLDRLVALALSDTNLRVYDLRSGSATSALTFTSPKTSGICTNCLWKDSVTLVSSHYDGLVRVWDTRGKSKIPVAVVRDTADLNKIFGLDLIDNVLMYGGDDSKVSTAKF
ncbi:hypothetical protein GEMRC1_011313 [Eukaryota sp. GEM-RC1]